MDCLEKARGKTALKGSGFSNLTYKICKNIPKKFFKPKSRPREESCFLLHNRQLINNADRRA